MSQNQEKNPSVNLFSPENMIDPYPLYKQLRDEEPVHYLEEMKLKIKLNLEEKDFLNEEDQEKKLKEVKQNKNQHKVNL